jgi:hypothetical protein
MLERLWDHGEQSRPGHPRIFPKAGNVFPKNGGVRRGVRGSSLCVKVFLRWDVRKIGRGFVGARICGKPGICKVERNFACRQSLWIE